MERLKNEKITSSHPSLSNVFVPVSIEMLKKLDDVKIEYGNYRFEKVRIIGQIVSMLECNNIGATTEYNIDYQIRDFENDDKHQVIHVVHPPMDSSRFSFIEGTIVQVFGKIQCESNTIFLEALKIIEVDHPGILQIFPKEMRFTELYFTKDIPKKICTGEISDLIGTFLCPSLNNSMGSVNQTKHIQPQKPMKTKSFVVRHGGPEDSLNLQDQILEYFATHQIYPRVGLSIDIVKAGVLNNFNFENNINELVKNGKLVQTIDKKHYYAILSD